MDSFVEFMIGAAGVVFFVVVVVFFVYVGAKGGITEERAKWCRVTYTTIMDFEGCKEEGIKYQPKK